MSAVHRQSVEWWEDDERTQAVPLHQVAGARDRRRGAATMPLRAVPSAATQPYQAAPAAAPARQAGPALPTLPDFSRVIVTGAVVAILALLLYLGITGLIGWLRLKLDDMHYGRPRTFQTSAYVGHGESPGNPSHFVALNLNRRVTVIEFPGGDVSKPQVVVGPYLFGRAEDLTVVRLRLEDVNGDDKPDLTVRVKDERLVYMNENGGFRPITAEELAQLKMKEGDR
jgi:hypothetical protein